MYLLNEAVYYRLKEKSIVHRAAGYPLTVLLSSMETPSKCLAARIFYPRQLQSRDTCNTLGEVQRY